MLDINFIIENAEVVKAAVKKKHLKVDIDALLSLDTKRREVLQQVEALRMEQNTASTQIAKAESQEARDQIILEMKGVKENLQGLEENLKKIMDEWKGLMLQVPNVPDMSVPEGKSDEENVEVKVWGEQTHFDFEPKDHLEIMTNLGMVDFERGVKAHGFRGYFLTGAGADLSWAIWNYAREFFAAKDFKSVLPPVILGQQHFYGTGHLPGEADDLFKTQDDQYLTGTAEVPIMAYHADEILDADELPVKMLGFSPCFRREAGSHGKDTKGLIRVHEFYKLEQVVLCQASHQESVEWHEKINRNTEEFIETLGIPYHTVVNCGGDLGLGQVKKYDIELWVPKENKYREISSASYFHDFQTRRFNIRYKDKETNKINYAHSLNCTAIPTPRILVSLIENFQNADGSVRVPEPLQKYLGFPVITK